MQVLDLIAKQTGTSEETVTAYMRNRFIEIEKGIELAKAREADMAKTVQR